MRKLNVSTYVTLDGVFDDPGGAEGSEHGGWSIPYFDDEAANYAREQLWSSDALLLGRQTYEEFAANWPNMEEIEGDFAVRMNTLAKFVASSTLEEPLDWNNSSLTKGDVAEGVARLKDDPGQDVLMFSSVGLMHALMGRGLIHELRLWVHPVAVGTRRRVFPDGSARADLKLVDTTTLSSGVVILAYRPA